MSTLRLTTISNQGGTASVPSDTVINGTAKAWVNFNGSGTVAIRASFNVSSITDNGTGDYTVNFTNAMIDTNFSTLCTSGRNSGNWTSTPYVNTNPAGPSVQAPTTTSFRILTPTWNLSGYFDPSELNVAVFR